MRRSLFCSIKRFLHNYENSRSEPLKNDMTNTISLNHPDVLSLAARILKQGKVIAIPTDTVYGLAADLSNPDAVKHIYDIKGRDFKKPVAVCVSSVENIEKLAVVDILPGGLLKELLPGPVTVLLDPIQKLRGILGPNFPKIGIRVVPNSFVCALAKEFPGLALTSANESDSPSCLEPLEFQNLWPHLGLVVDGGRICGSREGSTIIDLSRGKKKYRVVREGSALSQTLATLHNYGVILEVDLPR